MTGYALRRVLATVPVFIFVALFVFFLLRVTPGDPAIMIAGDQATSAQIETVETSSALIDPWSISCLHGQASCYAAISDARCFPISRSAA